MRSLLFVSPRALSGKTTVIAGLARRLRQGGWTFSLRRLGNDANASADADLFSRFPGQSAASAQVSLIEAPAGEAAIPAEAGEAAVVAVAAWDVPAEDLAAFVQPFGERLAGVVLNCVPTRRREEPRTALARVGLQPLAVLPEDRLLAAPVLGDVAAALEAKSEFLDGNALRPVDRPLISSIAADPSQGYFARYEPSAVIVRSDKPDQQLGALNAGASCLIITGGLPVLSYVTDRVEEDEIPTLRTDLETLPVVERIEALYGGRPFAGGDEKSARAASLLDGLDLERLVS